VSADPGLRRAAAALGLMSLIRGSNRIAMKIAFDYVSPMDAAAVRFTLGAAAALVQLGERPAAQDASGMLPIVAGLVLRGIHGPTRRIARRRRSAPHRAAGRCRGPGFAIGCDPCAVRGEARPTVVADHALRRARISRSSSGRARTQASKGVPGGRSYPRRASRRGSAASPASAGIATVLLRAAGIPARYATGYSVQEGSEIEQRYVVRASHAHAWVLAWVDGRWREVDTTPAVWAQADAPATGQAAVGGRVRLLRRGRVPHTPHRRDRA
jgi:hypothetical protein